MKKDTKSSSAFVLPPTVNEEIIRKRSELGIQSDSNMLLLSSIELDSSELSNSVVLLELTVSFVVIIDLYTKLKFDNFNSVNLVKWINSFKSLGVMSDVDANDNDNSCLQ